MQTASVKLVLRKEKLRKDGTAPVWLRITSNRKSRFVSTGVYVEPKLWNEKRQEVRASHPIAPAINAKLRDLFHQAGQQALETPSATAVKASLSGTGGSLDGFLNQFIDGLNTAGRFWDWKKYRSLLAKLQGCFGERIDWQDLDRHALTRFERYLRDEHKNGPNTVRKELQRLRSVARRAIRDGVLKPAADPFLVYDRPKGEAVNRRKLSIEEIGKLEALDLAADAALETARDAFLVAFYGGGVRFGDVCQLRPGSVRAGRLEYRMMKTHSPVSVPLPPQAVQIVERYRKRGGYYLFPYLEKGDEADPVHLRRRINSRNVVVNNHLKTVAKRAGLESDGLSFHVARHSFADFARSKSGDLYAVSKALGHSSLQVTQQYLKSFDRDAVDRMVSGLWDTVSNEKPGV